MQRNKVHHVYTVGSVAKRLGVNESLILDLTVGLEPEDGVIWVYGIDEVRLLLEEYRRVAPPES